MSHSRNPYKGPNLRKFRKLLVRDAERSELRAQERQVILLQNTVQQNLYTRFYTLQNGEKMRASTKYLLKIPLEFALVFGFVSLFWYGFFSYLEYGAGMITEIHDHLPYYSMLLALIISLN